MPVAWRSNAQPATSVAIPQGESACEPIVSVMAAPGRRLTNPSGRTPGSFDNGSIESGVGRRDRRSLAPRRWSVPGTSRSMIGASSCRPLALRKWRKRQRKSLQKSPDAPGHVGGGAADRPSWAARAADGGLDRAVPGPDVSPGGLSAQGRRHLLASTDRRFDPADRDRSTHRYLHVHPRRHALDRPALGFPSRD